MNLSKKVIVLFAMSIAISATSCHTAENTKNISKTPVVDAIMARRSIRNYKDMPVEREKLELLAKCGVMAPSSHNNQTWEVRVVDSKAWIDSCSNTYVEAIKKAGKYDRMKFMFTQPYRNIFRNAPAVIFIGTKPESRFACEGIGMLGENIMLAAGDLGLGSCALGTALEIFAEPGMEEFVKSLEFPEGYTLRYALAIGYPDETPEATPRDLSKIRFVE